MILCIVMEQSAKHSLIMFLVRKTRNAIGRATYDKLKEGELIQLCVGARFGGYASSVGRPVVFGKMPEEMRKKVQFGLDAHKKTLEWVRREQLQKI